MYDKYIGLKVDHIPPEYGYYDWAPSTYKDNYHYNGVIREIDKKITRIYFNDEKSYSSYNTEKIIPFLERMYFLEESEENLVELFEKIKNLK